MGEAPVEVSSKEPDHNNSGYRSIRRRAGRVPPCEPGLANGPESCLALRVGSLLNGPGILRNLNVPTVEYFYSVSSF